MPVLIDTAIWSVGFRRNHDSLNIEQKVAFLHWKELVTNGDAKMIGIIRQETLSGIKREEDFFELREKLSYIDDLQVGRKHYELAAKFFNKCQEKGVAGKHIDLLICAVASDYDIEIFTLDNDFKIFSEYLPIKLYKIQKKYN